MENIYYGKKKRDINEVRRERGAHIENGWPHYSRYTGLCMCLDFCCQGEKGCKCKFCPCMKYPKIELHSARSPLALPLANTISLMPMDGTTNGEQ